LAWDDHYGHFAAVCEVTRGLRGPDACDRLDDEPGCLGPDRVHERPLFERPKTAGDQRKTPTERACERCRTRRGGAGRRRRAVECTDDSGMDSGWNLARLGVTSRKLFHGDQCRA
jgi:hypothetical protein